MSQVCNFLWHKMCSCVTRSYLWHTLTHQVGFYMCKNSRPISGVYSQNLEVARGARRFVQATSLRLGLIARTPRGGIHTRNAVGLSSLVDNAATRSVMSTVTACAMCYCPFVLFQTAIARCKNPTSHTMQR